MKRTCNGCKAYHLRINNHFLRSPESVCDLGFKCELTSTPLDNFKCIAKRGAKPLEECPKPKTWKEYDEYYENIYVTNSEPSEYEWLNDIF